MWQLDSNNSCVFRSIREKGAIRRLRHLRTDKISSAISNSVTIRISTNFELYGTIKGWNVSGNPKLDDINAQKPALHCSFAWWTMPLFHVTDSFLERSGESAENVVGLFLPYLRARHALGQAPNNTVLGPAEAPGALAVQQSRILVLAARKTFADPDFDYQTPLAVLLTRKGIGYPQHHRLTCCGETSF